MNRQNGKPLYSYDVLCLMFLLQYASRVKSIQQTRLEISYTRIEDAGEYECEAVYHKSRIDTCYFTLELSGIKQAQSEVALPSLLKSYILDYYKGFAANKETTSMLETYSSAFTYMCICCLT